MTDYKKFIDPAFVYAIVGATQNHEKYGWIVFDNLRRKGFKVIPVNPKYHDIDGEPCFPDVASVSQKVDVVVLVVPPAVGLPVVKQVVEEGIKKIWCQSGAESKEIIKTAEAQGINIIADGSCIMLASLALRKS